MGTEEAWPWVWLILNAWGSWRQLWWDTCMVGHQTLLNPMASVAYVSLERNTLCLLLLVCVCTCVCAYMCMCMSKCVFVCVPMFVEQVLICPLKSLRPGSAALDP